MVTELWVGTGRGRGRGRAARSRMAWWMRGSMSWCDGCEEIYGYASRALARARLLRSQSHPSSQEQTKQTKVPLGCFPVVAGGDA
jgi:hypothetical protein